MDAIATRRMPPAPMPAPTSAAPARARGADEPPADTHSSHAERSALTAGLTATAIVGGKAKGFLIDRPRALAAFPHARSHGKTAKWAAEVVTGKLTNDVVPITGGTVTAFGRTITTQGWKRSYQTSNAIGFGLLGVSLLYGFPNLLEGIHDGDGVEGLVTTKAGRTGALATVGNIVGLGVMGFAFARAPGGKGRLAAMLHDPIHSATPLVLLRIGVGVPVTANELGYFDFLDSDAQRGAWENAKATTGSIARTVNPFD